MSGRILGFAMMTVPFTLLCVAAVAAYGWRTGLEVILFVMAMVAASEVIRRMGAAGFRLIDA